MYPGEGEHNKSKSTHIRLKDLTDIRRTPVPGTYEKKKKIIGDIESTRTSIQVFIIHANYPTYFNRNSPYNLRHLSLQQCPKFRNNLYKYKIYRSETDVELWCKKVIK